MPEELEDDVKAISTLISVLKPLDQNARVHVLEFVLKRLGISLTQEPAAPAQSQPTSHLDSTPASPPTPAHSAAVDIRSFAAEKNPKTINERLAVIAYYLAHLAPPAERRDYITSDDIKTYFIHSGFELPTALGSVTLSNAKNAGYLNALDRGHFKLNAVGHNLVAHKLPGGETGEKKRHIAKKTKTKKARPKAKK
ncbi:MAG: hypothetical protein ABR881_32360 [Candidatus Sulfotelmatobacter sp.]